MGVTSGIHGRDEKCIQNSSWNMQREKVSGVTTIFKCTLLKQSVKGCNGML